MIPGPPYREIASADPLSHGYEMDARRPVARRALREIEAARGDVVRRPTRRRWTLYLGLGCLLAGVVVAAVALS